MLKLVPFNDIWVSSAKLDLHAIYRRPRWTQDEFDELVQARDPEGLPLWDITTPLRVLDHNRLRAKGFEYVTLASRKDLQDAAHAGTVQLLPGMTSWREYDQHQTGGPWNYKKYIAGQQDADTAALQKLKADVEQFGSDAVESLQGIKLPESLKGIAPKSKARTEKVAAA
jgi:hypothetical protein